MTVLQIFQEVRGISTVGRLAKEEEEPAKENLKKKTLRCNSLEREGKPSAAASDHRPSADKNCQCL